MTTERPEDVAELTARLREPTLGTHYVVDPDEGNARTSETWHAYKSFELMQSEREEAAAALDSLVKERDEALARIGELEQLLRQARDDVEDAALCGRIDRLLDSTKKGESEE